MPRSILSRADGVVSKRSRSFLKCSRSAPYIFLEFTNHPVCAAEERDLFIEAQPPSLKRRGMGPEPHLDSSPEFLLGEEGKTTSRRYTASRKGLPMRKLTIVFLLFVGCACSKVDAAPAIPSPAVDEHGGPAGDRFAVFAG